MKLFSHLIDPFGRTGNDTVAANSALGLLREGGELSRAGKADEALAVLDDAIERFGEDRAERDLVVWCRLERAVALERLNRPDEALAAFRSVVRVDGGRPSPFIREMVARARAGIVLSLLDSGRQGEAIRVADDSLARLAHLGDTRLDGQVAILLLLKADALGREGRRDEELATHQELIDRFGATVDESVAPVVGKALVERAAALAQLGRYDEACAGYDLALHWIADRAMQSPDPSLAELTAEALSGKGLSFFDRGRFEEAIECYEMALAQLGDPPAPELAVARSLVLNNRGAALSGLERWGDALADYEECLAIRLSGNAGYSNPSIATVMANKAEALAALARCGEAVATCDEIEARLAGIAHPVARTVLEEVAQIRRTCASQ